MELRHLRYFVVVAEEQNVTRAAARLHVSQPPLSRQIRDLEEELGVELFRRTAKSLALTEAGKIFLIEARSVLLRVDQAVETVRAAAKGDRGRLRVGYAPSLTVEFLPRALRAFERENPGARISLYDLSTEECVRKLTEHKLDVALTARPSKTGMRALTFEKLASYPVCCALAASHPLAGKRLVPWRLLRQERFLLYSREEYPEYLDWMQGLCRAHGFEPRLGEEHDGVNGLMTAVEAGRGVAIVPSSVKCLTGPRLKLLPLTPSSPALIVGAVHGHPVSRLVETFIHAVSLAAKNKELKL
jgi:DNA-binding transcriptional LysR family regulator